MVRISSFRAAPRRKDLLRSGESSETVGISGCLTVRNQHDTRGISTNAAMQEDFVQRVHQCRSKPELSTQKCCYYIQTHLNKKSTCRPCLPMWSMPKPVCPKSSNRKWASPSRNTSCVKIGLAKQLLWADDTPIFDIAEQLCFSTQSYFSEQFQKVTGFTPGEYQQK